MATWRRKIIELFPDLQQDVQERESLYLLFSELAQRCWQAHEAGDIETLRKVYGFAEWCFAQPAKELWNAAGVSFYEHVVQSPAARRDFPRWVRPEIFEDVASLIEGQVGPDALAEMRRAYRREPWWKPRRC